MLSISIKKGLNSSIIQMNEQTRSKIKTDNSEIILHFGQLTTKLTIEIVDTLKHDTIWIPKKLNENISIPSLPYEFYFKENHLFLGSVIGFMIQLSYFNNPEIMKLRFSKYDEIKGLLFMFRKKNINKSENYISGYYYNPKSKKFIKGKFPYPSALFIRIRIENEEYKYFTEKGVSIFNYPYENVDKLKFWNLLSKSDDIKHHLPYTQKYTNVCRLMKIHSKYHSLYLKPRTLSQGREIYHLKMDDGNYILVDNIGQQLQINSQKELTQILKEKLNNQYIVQEEIIALEQSEKIDFRIYLQKGIDQKWKYTAMEARIAKKDSIITNSSGREKVIPGELAMKNFYYLDNQETAKKTKEITQICIKCFNIMEQNGYHLGDAAVDFILDKNKKLWLLEVQLNYAAEKKANWTESDKKILPDILPTPFEYAKSLAGFK